MPKSSQRPTLRDIARLANVSPQTVSRVINDHPYVSDDKRERVREVMRAMNYRPNKVAQMLSTQRSNYIEVITPHESHSFFRNTITHISITARQRGYQVLFEPVDEEDFVKTLSSSVSHLVDGIILIAPAWITKVTDDELHMLTQGMPIALIAAELGSTLPSVIYDQEVGARLATQHLIDLGHRKIAEITGSLNISDAVTRHKTWEKTLTEHGIPSDMSVEGNYSVKGGYEATHRLLKSGAEFTALFAGNDSMALGAVLALHEKGLRVPDDISLVGFDDIEEAAYFLPPLTTIRQDLSRLGQLITECLLTQIEQPDEACGQQVLQPELVVRRSTRALT